MSVKAPPRLLALAAELASAKRDEAAAKARRNEVEAQIVSLLDFKQPEGQITYEVATLEGSTTKVVLKQPVTSKFDSDSWPNFKKQVSATARKAVVTEYKLDTKLAKALQENEQEKDSWNVISKLLTRKPGKVSVDVKEVHVEPGQNLDDLSEEFPESEGEEA